MKLLKLLTLAVFLLTTSSSYATLLLTEDDYITVDHQGVKIDWAWASDFNVQFNYENGELFNELLAPETLGWREATSEEFSFFTANITSSDFRSTGGGYKTASRFFNINKDNEYNVSITDFDSGYINSNFREGTTLDFDIWSLPDEYWFDTFYVRNSLAPTPKPIPEPLSILIFATAFIVLQLKMRKNSA